MELRSRPCRACNVRVDRGAQTVPGYNLTGLEARIRTLSVSLLAVAAIAASLLLTRRQEKPPAGVPAGENLPAEQSLDAIRAAGL